MSGLFKAIFGGGGSSQPSAPKGAAAPASTAPAGTAPGTTAEDYKRQQEAYYQQMLAGLGQGQPGGGLPEGIQKNIEAQAASLK